MATGAPTFPLRNPVVDAGLAPGMAVSVAVGDWVAYARGFGVADLASGRPVTDDTPFYIASSTKSLTATAAAVAAARGELDLRRPHGAPPPGRRACPEGAAFRC